jgi:hypothetical protein
MQTLQLYSAMIALYLANTLIAIYNAMTLHGNYCRTNFKINVSYSSVVAYSILWSRSTKACMNQLGGIARCASNTLIAIHCYNCLYVYTLAIYQGAYNIVKAAFVVLLCFTAGGALKEETDIRGALEELVRVNGYVQQLELHKLYN